MLKVEIVVRVVLAACCLLIVSDGNAISGADSPKTEWTNVSWRDEQTRKPGNISFTPLKLELDGKVVPAESGRLVVRESRRSASAKLIEVAFTRIKTTASKPGAPLVYLTGGPGQSATGLLRFPDFLKMFVGLSQSRDIILLDIRGAGLSSPTSCFTALLNR
jgi:pimeloyl-ACP methyl ester carboxylesterase